MIVTAVDVGYINLAVVSVVVDEENDTIGEVVHCSNTDLREVRCKKKNCIFDRNDKGSSHKILHFLESGAFRVFDNSDYIVIERQPLVGLTGVEQSLLIMLKNRYRRRKYIELISPNTLHAHYGLSTDRAERKQQVEGIVGPYLETFRNYKRATRKHDMADACIYCLFFIQVYLPNILSSKRANIFNKFRYVECS